MPVRLQKENDKLKIQLSETPIDLYAVSGIAVGTTLDVQCGPGGELAYVKAGADGATPLEDYNFLGSGEWRLFEDQTLMAYSKRPQYVTVNNNELS